MEEKKIIVFYIDVRLLTPDEVKPYINSVSKRIAPEKIDGEILFIPVYGETKVECIDPVYITEPELIRKHRLLMDELHEHLEHQINELKDGTNEGEGRGI